LPPTVTRGHPQQVHSRDASIAQFVQQRFPVGRVAFERGVAVPLRIVSFVDDDGAGRQLEGGMKLRARGSLHAVWWPRAAVRLEMARRLWWPGACGPHA